MALEEQARAFVQQLQELYFAKGDLQALLSVMDSHSSLIGTGRDELCYNLEELLQKLQGELENFSGCFTIEDSHYDVLTISERGCVVFGCLNAVSENSVVADLHCRITAVCRRDEDGMKLLHLHMSTPDWAQEPGTSYASRALAQEREELQDQVSKTMSSLQTLTENIPGGVQCCHSDEALTIISLSDGFYSLFGYSREEIHAQFQDSFLAMVYPDDRAQVQETIRCQLTAGNTVELEYRVCHKDGTILWVMDRGKLVSCADGQSLFYCVLLDITPQKREREELRLTLERHQVIMDQATDIIFEWDICTDTIVYSANWYKRFGYPPLSIHASTAIPLSGNIHPDDVEAFQRLVKESAAGTRCSEAELRIRDTMDSYIWCRIRATTQFGDDGTPVRAVGVIVDIDADKRQRQQLIDQAERDSLTWLLNKAATKAHVSKLLATSDPQPAALFIMDLDNFKGVNDTYGHLCGDALLTDVANALQRIFRAGDVLGRIGGDEFLMFLPGLTPDRAEERAFLLLDTLSEIQIGSSQHFLSACVGAAFFPGDGGDFYSLYHLADCALYQAKRSNRGGYCTYDPALCGGEAATTGSRYSGSVIDSDTGMVREQMAQYAFRMLYGAKNTVLTLHQLMEIVGRSYDISRLYIAEDSPDGDSRGITFLWCGEGTPHCEDYYTPHSYHKELQGLKERYDENGRLDCREVSKLPEPLRSFYGRMGTRSMLQIAMMDEGVFRGAVCFDDCRVDRAWTQEQLASLSLIAKVFSSFLLKQRYKEQASGDDTVKSFLG